MFIMAASLLPALWLKETYNHPQNHALKIISSKLKPVYTLSKQVNPLKLLSIYPALAEEKHSSAPI